MRLSLNNFDFSDIYDLIGQETLSFADKVFEYYSFDAKMINEDLPEAKNCYNPVVASFIKMIEELKTQKSKVLIIGDYDCDGIAATVIFSRLLNYLGITNNYLIPSRIKDGYGISTAHVKMAASYHFDVIVTLDNGIVAYDAIALAKKYGLRVMVIDHHQFTKLPDADTVVHPDLLPEGFNNLCTAGLCFVLSTFFYDDDYSKQLAMVATIADVMRVTGYNRRLLREGLLLFDQKTNTPLHRLIKRQKNYSYNDIAFQLIPKINAVSRMDHLANVNHLVKYLRTADQIDDEAAEKIVKINELRKTRSKAMTDTARQMIRGNDEVILIKNEEFLEGLCGLVAGNLTAEFNKPAIVLTANRTIYKGSARSITGIDLYDALVDFDRYAAFGGHKKALGLSVEKDHYHAFQHYVSHLHLVYKPQKNRLIYLDFKDLNCDDLALLVSLAPFGEGFPEPTFFIDHPQIVKCFMIKGMYPKYTLTNNVEAIGFDQRLYQKNVRAIIGKLAVNSFGITKKINISIEEIVL